MTFPLEAKDTQHCPFCSGFLKFEEKYPGVGTCLSCGMISDCPHPDEFRDTEPVVHDSLDNQGEHTQWEESVTVCSLCGEEMEYDAPDREEQDD